MAKWNWYKVESNIGIDNGIFKRIQKLSFIHLFAPEFHYFSVVFIYSVVSKLSENEFKRKPQSLKGSKNLVNFESLSLRGYSFVFRQSDPFRARDFCEVMKIFMPHPFKTFVIVYGFIRSLKKDEILTLLILYKIWGQLLNFANIQKYYNQ